MPTTRIRFQRVQLKAVRRWKDGDGKWHQQTKVFEQTMNPFNKNEHGLPKSRSEIVAELHLEREAWLANPLQGGVHANQ